jgi:hypothetical protein
MHHKKKHLTDLLMRFGWIILLLILIYAGLAFFDLVPPFNQNHCNFDEGVKCSDLTYYDGQVQFAIRNQEDFDMQETKLIIEASNCEGTTEPILHEDHEIEIYSFDCNSTRVIKGKLTLDYKNDESGLRHTVEGKFKLFP